ETQTKIFLEAKGIEKFAQLEELTISMSDGKDLVQLKEVLSELKNLKKLEMKFGSNDEDFSNWDEHFPFESIANLKELKTVSSPDFDNGEWGGDFIKNLHHLKNLEVLDIFDSWDQK